MDKTYKLYLDDQISPQAFGIRYKPLEERLNQIDDQIPELQGEMDFLKIKYLSSDQVLHEAKDLYSRWLELLPEEKRNIVEAITEQIIIGSDDVTINLCYIPAPLEMTVTGQRNLSPVPPVFRREVSLPLENLANRYGSSLLGIPIPVSETVTVSGRFKCRQVGSV